MRNDTTSNSNDPQCRPESGKPKSVARNTGKRMIGFIIGFFLFFLAYYLIIHYDNKHDFSLLVIFGLFILANAVVIPVYDLICKKLGLDL